MSDLWGRDEDATLYAEITKEELDKTVRRMQKMASRIEELEAEISYLRTRDKSQSAYIEQVLDELEAENERLLGLAPRWTELVEELQAENERLRVVAGAAKRYEDLFARTRDKPYGISKELQALFDALAALEGNDD